MLPLAGYADKYSARPGEAIRFHVANATGAPVTSHIVRVISADPNPAGQAIKVEAVTGAGLAEIAVPHKQVPPRGAYAVVENAYWLEALKSFTFMLTIWPSAAKDQCLANWTDDLGIEGVSLSLNEDGSITWTAGPGECKAVGGTFECRVRERVWTTVACRYDHHSKQLRISTHEHSSHATDEIEIDLSELVNGVVHGTDGILELGGPEQIFEGVATLGTFSGKFERPMFFDRSLSLNEIERASRGEPIPGLIAAWDFSREMHTNRIIDTGPHATHGTLINTPTRAVRGSTWTGREQCFRHAPDQYAAIHFHDDDIDDCLWPATHEYTVPANLRSGAYALIVKAGDAEDNIPFFVVPPKGTQTSRLAVLVSTFTYTVYGNHARPEWTADPKWQAAWKEQAKAWKAYPHNPGDHREYGLSTYNHHTDGSGIAMASWHRPMLNQRIGYVTYPYPDIRSSGLRHYPADSHLLAWLEAKGQPYDLITDWELHHEGVDLLKRYTCVMTGSHPEYHTTEMLDALEAYRDGGGRFMYLGGNGFYWKIALSPDKPGLIEIRRAEGGIRAWAAEPGEYYNQFDGEYGGLWRRNGRPPQKLAGVGFTAQGNFVGSHYRVTPEGRADPRSAWMFKGITDATIGGFGFSGHGAAGFELDRADKRLGTPAHAHVVARSENHPPDAPWVLVPEEQLTHITTIPGESHSQLIRADMILFETPNNGCVFSTGSITFCGSLPHNGFDNTISTLLANVLARFLDPGATFPLPPA
jgi:N,N-dimethylformamidase